MRPGERTGTLSGEQQDYAVATWRYLRLAMIVLVVGLGVSIGYERGKTHPSCFQLSISAYYYTPVRSVLVGALIAIAVCLVSLRGNTHAEDVLLNLAGMFASIVAMVPIPKVGSCGSVLATAHDRDVSIANNVFALLAMGLLALLIGAAITLGAAGSPTLSTLAGYAFAVLVWLVTALLFELARGFFVRTAHYTAAALMFVCVLAVVVLNAASYRAKTGAARMRNRYSAIASAMVLAIVIVGVAGAFGWAYWVLGMEASLVTLFAVFWVAQTQELWRQGIR